LLQERKSFQSIQKILEIKIWEKFDKKFDAAVQKNIQLYCYCRKYELLIGIKDFLFSQFRIQKSLETAAYSVYYSVEQNQCPIAERCRSLKINSVQTFPG
jgi:hypothetical protein